MSAYYNEIDPYAAQWLRNLIAANLIAPGDVDERSIVDVRPDDLAGYVQCHFFAGIGGWSLGARLAGWPDDRPLWSGSCPCQPFSVAGKGAGQADDRHLWPAFFGLIRACRPDVVVGEQVAAAVGKDWLDGVSSDLEGVGYACRAAVVPACAVDAPHRRDRLWFVADSSCFGVRGKRSGAPIGATSGMQGAPRQRERLRADAWTDGVLGDGATVALANPDDAERRAEEPRGHVVDGSPAGWIQGDRDAPERRDGAVGDAGGSGLAFRSRAANERRTVRQEGSAAAAADDRGPWGAAAWLLGADGKARRVEPGIRLLAHGVPARVGRLRAYGNAIVPQVAAEVLGAYLDLRAAA